MNHEPSGPAPAGGMGKVFQVLATSPLYWLLAAIPVAYVLEYAGAAPMWVFAFSAMAIVPLAGLMGRATENLAATLGPGIGGLMNATFGNAAELIIAIMAIRKGPAMYPLVKASLTGSIIGNILLVLGLSVVAGGMFHRRQTFNATAAGMGATLLALAGIGLLMPTMHYYVSQFHAGAAAGVHAGHDHTIEYLSEEIAVVLAGVYALSLFFSLKTHSHLFSGEETEEDQHLAEWSRGTATTVLLVATVGVALMSELLVGSVEHTCKELGLGEVFVGVIVLAIIGNAAEHSTAVLVAMKNKMDLAVNIAVGSSLQIALFVAPMLVFASLAMGHEQPLDLHFSPMEVIAVLLSIGVLALVCNDGETHWMEGVMLLAVYVILALAFYHLPNEPHAAAATEHAMLPAWGCPYVSPARG